MSKRNNKKQHTMKVVKTPQPVSQPVEFGFEDVLSELEAIVFAAENRQSEAQAA